jgi:hypothetical protein
MGMVPVKRWPPTMRIRSMALLHPDLPLNKTAAKGLGVCAQAQLKQQFVAAIHTLPGIDGPKCVRLVQRDLSFMKTDGTSRLQYQCRREPQGD